MGQGTDLTSVIVTADTNILVRALMGDDPRQGALAQAERNSADGIALTLTALCELVWGLARGYKIPRADIAAAIGRLINAGNVVVDRPAVEAGLAMLTAGADFADGVIAREGSWLGAETFVSFDEKMVAALTSREERARVVA